MLRALGFHGGRNKDSGGDNQVPEVVDDQPHNPFTELQVLTNHSDIVRCLSRIDHSRFVSAGDDGKVIIWQAETGCQLHALAGHQRPVTAILLLPSSNKSEEIDSRAFSLLPGDAIQAHPVDGTVMDWLVTASSDKTIQIWNVHTGKHYKTIQSPGSVKCLVSLYHGTLFCSAGQDICIWNTDGDLLCHVSRPKADSDIHTVVPIRGNHLVVASDRPCLSVYNVSELPTQAGQLSMAFFRDLQPHREAIRCLVIVSDAMIASSSLDGMIVLWSTLSLNAMRKFNVHQDYRDSAHSFQYCVNHMLALEGRYLLAAIGRGFSMFDVIVDLCIVKRSFAHSSSVLHLALVAGGSLLATCSEDSMIRLWRINTTSSDGEEHKKFGRAPSSSSPIETFMGEWDLVSHRKNTKPIIPALVGQLAGHGAAVQHLLDCSPSGFVSCSSDTFVILWKAGYIESQKRDEAVRSYLRTGCKCEDTDASRSLDAST